MFLRDKTYIRTADDLLFNVAGDRHPVDHVYASLKYVGNLKWTAGYQAAINYLREHHPQYVGDYICIPTCDIQQIYCPRRRWQELIADCNPSRLHQQALELAARLSELFLVPLTEFGLTDSLLWSDGHEDSDIDLVVFGIRHAESVLQFAPSLYDSDDFDRPDPMKMRSPYGTDVRSWPQLLNRKSHMGSFRGRLFSLRCIRTQSEVDARRELPVRFNTSDLRQQRQSRIDFQIVENCESLCFPAVYRDGEGHELVDYSVVYEGVFRAGETVRCNCHQEQVCYDINGRTEQVMRYNIAGECDFLQVLS